MRVLLLLLRARSGRTHATHAHRRGGRGRVGTHHTTGRGGYTLVLHGNGSTRVGRRAPTLVGRRHRFGGLGGLRPAALARRQALGRLEARIAESTTGRRRAERGPGVEATTRRSGRHLARAHARARARDVVGTAALSGVGTTGGFHPGTHRCHTRRGTASGRRTALGAGEREGAHGTERPGLHRDTAGQRLQPQRLRPEARSRAVDLRQLLGVSLEERDLLGLDLLRRGVLLLQVLDHRGRAAREHGRRLGARIELLRLRHRLQLGRRRGLLTEPVLHGLRRLGRLGARVGDTHQRALRGPGTLTDPRRTEFLDGVVEVVCDPRQLTAVVAPRLAQFLGRAGLVVDRRVRVQLLAVPRGPVRPRSDGPVVAVLEAVGTAARAVHEIRDLGALVAHDRIDVRGRRTRAVSPTRRRGGLAGGVSVRVHDFRFPLLV